MNPDVLFRRGLFSSLAEERAEDIAAGLLQNAPRHFYAVVRGEQKYIRDRSRHARFRVKRAEKNALQAGLNDRAGTHQTWFQCDIEIAVDEPP